MKYLVIFKALDRDKLGQWHSGSCERIYTEVFDTEQEALDFVKERVKYYADITHTSYSLSYMYVPFDEENAVLDMTRHDFTKSLGIFNQK